MTDEHAPKHLGRFRLEAEIGRGATGQVYRAYDTSLDTVVCLKLLHPALRERADIVDRLKREVLLARRVQHPGLCQIFDFHEEGRYAFLTLEYVAGSTLSEVLRERSRLSVTQTLGFMSEAFDAVDAAHKKGVIHRDLKPSNLMIDKSGRLKILDFGLAISANDEATADPKAKKFELIDKFISANPKIKPPEAGTALYDLSKAQMLKPETLMTETLARIYVEQKNYSSAIQSYKILSLKYPEKSGFFADQIKAIKELEKQNKNS